MMIRRIEAMNYRCLQYTIQEINRFQVFAGQNGSGKRTFFDAIAFLGDLVSGGLEKAIGERTDEPRDLVWGRAGNRFELAVELAIPEDRRARLDRADYSVVRYETAVGFSDDGKDFFLAAERVILRSVDGRDGEKSANQLSFFQGHPPVPKTLSTPLKTRNTKAVVNKIHGGNDNYYSEVHSTKGKGWLSFRLGPRQSALGNLPADEAMFPVSTWLKKLLSEEIRCFNPNGRLMKHASPAGQGLEIRLDGANFPWVVENLRNISESRFEEWVAHLRTALPEIGNVRTVERPSDKSRYLTIQYVGGLEIPSWLASEGTLRLLYLTLPPYLPHFHGICLVEDPENGIHPRSVETVFQSLSSVYDAQIFIITHSPVLLNVAEPAQVLCFSRGRNGAAEIVRAADHAALREWKGETGLGILFAGGVLG